MTPKERLENLGWKFDKDLMLWYNGDRNIELDDKYVDIFIYNDGEFNQGYLTYEELVLFGKLIEEKYGYERE